MLSLLSSDSVYITTIIYTFWNVCSVVRDNLFPNVHSFTPFSTAATCEPNLLWFWLHLHIKPSFLIILREFVVFHVAHSELRPTSIAQLRQLICQYCCLLLSLLHSGTPSVVGEQDLSSCSAVNRLSKKLPYLLIGALLGRKIKQPEFSLKLDQKKGIGCDIKGEGIMVLTKPQGGSLRSVLEITCPNGSQHLHTVFK